MKKHGRLLPGWYPLLIFPSCALLILAAQAFAVTIVQVKGASMLPTFHEGQVVLVDRVAYGIRWPIISQNVLFWNPPHSGDLVVIRRPNSNSSLVKRIFATEGQKLSIVDHRLVSPSGSVALSPSQEYWLSACPAVPEGTVFVVGDNAPFSQDSRDWGFLALENVVGRPWT